MKQKYIILSNQKNTAVPIYLQVSICQNGFNERWKYRTPFKVNPKYWNAKREQAETGLIMGLGERKTLEDLNVNLNDFREYVESCFIRDSVTGSFSKTWIKDVGESFSQTVCSNCAKSLLCYSEAFLSLTGLAESRQRQYRVLFRSLQRFEFYKRVKYHLNDFVLSALVFEAKSTTLQELWLYMQKEPQLLEPYPEITEALPYKKKTEGRSMNTTITVFKKLRAYFNWCVKNGYMTQNPFNSFEIPQEVYGTPVYFTVDEISRIYNYDLSDKPSLEANRDIFVFQSSVGCRISDLKALTRDNIVGDTLTYIPKKTLNKIGHTVSVPLSATAKEIIRKYSKNKRCGSSLLPFDRYDQHYNEDIRIICRMAGVTRMVSVLDPQTRTEKKVPISHVASSHTARKNFCGNLYEKVRDPNIVASMSGHAEGSRAFARYRAISMETKRDVMKALEFGSSKKK